MLELSTWVNGLPVSVALRRVVWFVPLLQTIHILSIGFVLSSLVMIDLRAWGVAQFPTLPVTGRRFLPWLWAALVVATLSGIGLMLGAPRSFRDGAFVTKLYLMGAGVILTLALGLVLRSQREMKNPPMFTAGLLGTAALVLWFGATLAGRGRWIAGWIAG